MIAANLMKSPLSAYALRVLAVGLFVVALLGVLRGYFQGLGTMMPTAVSQIIEQVVNAVVSIAGASVLFKIGIAAGESETKNCSVLHMVRREEHSEPLPELFLHCCFYCFHFLFTGK